MIIMTIIIIILISTMNSNNRIAATLFPTDTVCLWNISINTVHKGDDDGIIIIIIIIIIMLQCCGIKQYTQTEKLQQIGQI